MGKKKQTQEPIENGPATEVVATEPVAEPAPKAKGKKKAKAPGGDITLAELTDRYIAALEDQGKSAGTAMSYRMEMVLAQKELGAQTPLRELTPERVEEFFASTRVCKTRGGLPKARVSVEKTRRVLRQALRWAETTGLVETVPAPVGSAPAT